MGHIRHMYLLQMSEFAGYYKNPFKFRGRGIKYTKWKTVGACNGTCSNAEIKGMWLEAHNARDQQKLQRYRVLYKRDVIISHTGRVYERYVVNPSESWMRMKEIIPGCEELI